ncbi:ABC transporter substrate-binding protein [Pseudooceanicola sp. CBS1P-1]|uniref:Probable sugar-binding periplasmic protein n=1 Tax=Pseudooceanicola albus TaxID=2692189 RepID=A0A6L7G7A2_9RHOB|nr:MULTISPECIES: ABC transporter substrate-binding protein [Pseudooceanicola]MBT9385155.1 ABC transporter substrate-binding protein [Pseudooceanicola endophyticus]MXN18553.1 extracellular solute-binding protein [Pseudooceanicola albus]
MKLASLLLAGVAFAATTGMAAAEDLKAEVFTSWTTGGELKAADAIKQAFEARGGTWETSSVAGFENANAAFQNRMMAGDPPAAKQVVIGMEQREYIDGGLYMPITKVAEAGHWADVMPKAIYDNVTFDGEVYEVPTGIHGESWMFYSMAAFKKAGIEAAPADWDSFFADMDKLKAAGLTPIAWGGQSWQETKVFNMILLSQVGLDGFRKIYIDRDAAAIKSEGVRKTLEIFGKLRGYIDEGAAGRNWNDATAMVIKGTAGVQFMGDWAKGEFSNAGETAGVDYGCALAPASPGMIYIGDAFAFPNLKGAEAAQDLLAEVVMDPKVQVAFSLAKGSIPVRTDVDTSQFDVCTQQAITLMNDGKIVPEHAITLTLEQTGMLTDFVGDFFSNPEADLDDAMESFAEVFE